MAGRNRACADAGVDDVEGPRASALMHHELSQPMARWLGRGALAAIVGAMYLPVLVTFIYSFNASRIGTVWTGFSLRGYTELVEQTDLWQALGASCLIGVAASTLSVIAGTMAALG